MQVVNGNKNQVHAFVLPISDPCIQKEAMAKQTKCYSA